MPLLHVGPPLSTATMNKLKVTELRAQLSERKLPTKGLKKDLVKRLEKAIADEKAQMAEQKAREQQAKKEASESTCASPPYIMQTCIIRI